MHYKITSVNSKYYEGILLSKQILKSGISISANVVKATGAQSRNHFNAKLAISYKEARETHY